MINSSYDDDDDDIDIIGVISCIDDSDVDGTNICNTTIEGH